MAGSWWESRYLLALNFQESLIFHMCCLSLTCFCLVPVLLWREVWGQSVFLKSYEPSFFISESVKKCSCGDLLSNTTGILVEFFFLVTCIHFVTFHWTLYDFQINLVILDIEFVVFIV